MWWNWNQRAQRCASFLPVVFVCSSWRGNVCVSWTGPEDYLQVLCVQLGDASSAHGQRHTLCSVREVLLLSCLFSVWGRQEVSCCGELLLSLHGNTRRQDRGWAPHTFASLFQGLLWGFPWGSRKDLQKCSPWLRCTAAAVAFSGSWFPVKHHLPKMSVSWSLQRAFTAAIELPWALCSISVLSRTEWRCWVPNHFNCSEIWVQPHFLEPTQVMTSGRDLQQGMRNTWQDLVLSQPSTLVRILTRHQVQDCHINLRYLKSVCKTLYETRSAEPGHWHNFIDVFVPVNRRGYFLAPEPKLQV